MAFLKRTIKDRVIQYPKRYQLVEVSPGEFDLVPVTGIVTEAGTPVNKDLLQRYEDTLGEHDLTIPNKLDKNGDSKDNLVTFPTQIHADNILTGEKHSTLFSKIRFWIETFIAHGLNTVKHITATERTTWNGKAPNSHASSATTYGPGTPTLHGHVKTINALTQASHVDGTALSAYQGKVLNDKVVSIETNLKSSVSLVLPSRTKSVVKNVGYNAVLLESVALDLKYSSFINITLSITRFSTSYIAKSSFLIDRLGNAINIDGWDLRVGYEVGMKPDGINSVYGMYKSSSSERQDILLLLSFVRQSNLLKIYFYPQKKDAYDEGNRTGDVTYSLEVSA